MNCQELLLKSTEDSKGKEEGSRLEELTVPKAAVEGDRASSLTPTGFQPSSTSTNYI